MSLSRPILVLSCVMFALGLGHSFAQAEFAPESTDRPPVAAPTSKIDVGAIPVVLSESQELDNLAAGLFQGLMADGRVKGVALVMVQNDHVMLQRNAGEVTPNTRFAAGALPEMFDAVSTMQLIERGRVMPDTDVGTVLGEAAPRGVTIAQVLTRRAGEPALLVRVVEKLAGARRDDYLLKEIAQPLGMSATSPREGRLETTPADLSHLMIALVNGGAFQTGRILEPASVETMERTHVTLHPALPGWAYGFSEMRRNGWRALQQEGTAGEFTLRLVIVPDAKLAYFLLARGQTNAAFWRALDNGLFDKALPRAADPPAAETVTAAAPDANQARAIRGAYEAAREPAFALSSLKIGDKRLKITAAADGALVLSGAENATLAPRAGGYWGTADGNLNAAVVDGRLLLSTGTYRPLAVYKRPELYSWFALLLALGAPGALYYERRSKRARIAPSDLVLGIASASVVFLFLSIFVWLFSPAV